MKVASLVLNRGTALVDLADIKRLGRTGWYIGGTGYAARNEWVNGRRRTVYMHRAILGLRLGDRIEADHINGNRSDNRRVNLRRVAEAEQRQNVAAHGRSGARGVTYNIRIGRWIAYARLHSRYHFIGAFAARDDAAKAASRWRRQHMPFTNETRHVEVN